jgi:hypothetical protein
MASFAVIAPGPGCPRAVSTGVGDGDGVGVNGRNVGDGMMPTGLADDEPPKSRVPTCVKASKIAVTIMLRAIHNRIMAVMRRVMDSS